MEFTLDQQAYPIWVPDVRAEFHTAWGNWFVSEDGGYWVGMGLLFAWKVLSRAAPTVSRCFPESFSRMAA